MIEVTDLDGRTHYLAPSAIAQVSQPGPSAAWHGIRAFIRLFDGRTMEVCEQPATIAAQFPAPPQADGGEG